VTTERVALFTFAGKPEGRYPKRRGRRSRNDIPYPMRRGTLPHRRFPEPSCFDDDERLALRIRGVVRASDWNPVPALPAPPPPAYTAAWAITPAPPPAPCRLTACVTLPTYPPAGDAGVTVVAGDDLRYRKPLYYQPPPPFPLPPHCVWAPGISGTVNS